MNLNIGQSTIDFFSVKRLQPSLTQEPYGTREGMSTFETLTTFFAISLQILVFSRNGKVRKRDLCKVCIALQTVKAKEKSD